ncbi:hypothetical protein Sinac_3808 [Singulisphaera acidiphila DSM 18658]|uniref:Uncharacterized protein n=1 Tax=Singulisphaera acidiphila (strain ATCC BAA-1392 / DSM 18658 / VKM B-2454 / MOB10) TaxID=886293 RepID=L0DH96_SINAD|nr:hypothetical protein Sinac_3808 [Singulisphaera acidiphila DSM 18658]
MGRTKPDHPKVEEGDFTSQANFAAPPHPSAHLGSTHPKPEVDFTAWFSRQRTATVQG